MCGVEHKHFYEILFYEDEDEDEAAELDKLEEELFDEPLWWRQRRKDNDCSQPKQVVEHLI